MGGVLCILLFILGTFLKGKLRVAADVGQSGALLEFRQFGFCGAQFVVDDADMFLDEVGAFWATSFFRCWCPDYRVLSVLGMKSEARCIWVFVH